MSKVTKKAKREKLKSQLAELLAKLQFLTDKDTPKTINHYFEWRSRPNIGYERSRAIVNLKKRIDLINRKLTALEG